MPLCGIRSSGGNGRMFFIKWFKGSEDLTVQIFKEGWSIPANVTAEIVMRFDRSAPWTVTSRPLDKAGNMLQFTIKHDTVRDFTRSFTQSSTMVIDFPGGSEASWEARLNGNSAAINLLAKCVTTLAGQGDTTNPYAYVFNQFASPTTPATQPFAPPASSSSTQPFRTAPAPSTRKTFDDEFAGPLKTLQE